MKRERRCLLAIAVLALLGTLTPNAAAGQLEIETYQRGEISFNTSTCSGNRFLIEFEGVFVHSQSQEEIRMPGYYDGNDTYRINFMPTEPGTWNWTTESSTGTGEAPACAALHGKSGSLIATVPSTKGLLLPTAEKKWQYSDGTYAIPLAFRLDWAHEDANLTRFEEVADFLRDTIKGHFLECTLDNGRGDSRCNGNGVSGAPFSPANGSTLQMDLAFWDRIEERVDVLAQRGLGVEFMFYSDDCGSPPWGSNSDAENLYLRHAVARLAAYPLVKFNTGIDIVETRGQVGVDHLIDTIASLDPYGHGRSSRMRSGSGNICAASRNYDSYGDNYACMSHSSNACTSSNGGGPMASYFLNGPPGDVSCYGAAPKSFGMEDGFYENNPSKFKSFTPSDIRRAAWKCLISGGCGMIVRGSKNADDSGGNNDGWFLLEPKGYQPQTFESDLESEQWLGLINPFLHNQLGFDFGEMVPRSDLVSGTQWYAIAGPGEEKIVYWGAGANDKWDLGGGGDVTVKLSSAQQGAYAAQWYDPRSGTFSNVGSGTLAGSANHVLTPPSTDDWVLYLTAPQDDTPPSVPASVEALALSDHEVQVSWSASTDADSGVSHYTVYRDGVGVGTTEELQYVDTELQELTTYQYQVSATNGSGLESDPSPGVPATTLADTTPPSIVSAMTASDPGTVIVSFSEPLEEASATAASNYTIDHGIAVNSASLMADLTTVVLSTTAHVENVTYTLTVNGVHDRAANPNPIIPDSSATYTYTVQLVITNLNVVSGEPYEVMEGLSNGDLVYIDRDYTYSQVPAYLLGASYIRTANDDKFSDGSVDFLSFDVNREVTVYIAHDDHYSVKPDWLTSFTDTGDNLMTVAEFSLFRRDYPSGSIVLGGNVHPDEPEDNSMYTVIVVGTVIDPIDPPAPPTNLQVN